MDKIIYNIASYKRGDTLINTIQSIYNQCDIINVALNDYDEIPVELYDKKINLFITDNDRGDAYKFYKLMDSDGYYFTIDDDLIYPENYTKYMVDKVNQYNRKSIITLHARTFNSFPINSFYNSKSTVYHFKKSLDKDRKVQFGGTGVMCFHTDLFKVPIEYFDKPNMADVWVGKYAKENNIEITCVEHNGGFVKQQDIDSSIYNTGLKNDDIQTKLTNECYIDKEISMKLVIVSTFWNSEKFVSDCIKSLKNQYYTNFVSYMIDDMSTDKSYDVAKKEIGDDERFILIKNTEKKYKTKNFIDVIRNNKNIDSNDVIIELDGDDQLIDNFVLGLINKIYTDPNIWICGSKWRDKKGGTMKYGRANADNPRRTSWNFSHMRTYRAFLFRMIKDADLRYNGQYFKAAVDLGIGIPMLEMSGNEHYYFLDEVTYLYTWHDHQSYSKNSSFGDSKLQGLTAKHIYQLPVYKKLIIEKGYDEIKINVENVPTSKELINDLLTDKPLNPKVSSFNYDLINQIILNKNVYNPKNHIKPIRENIPLDRNKLIEIKKGSIADEARKSLTKTFNKINKTPNIFGGKKRM